MANEENSCVRKRQCSFVIQYADLESNYLVRISLNQLFDVGKLNYLLPASASVKYSCDNIHNKVLSKASSRQNTF